MIREESRCEKEEGKHTDFFKDRAIADSINKTMKRAGHRDALVGRPVVGGGQLADGTKYL